MQTKSSPLEALCVGIIMIWMGARIQESANRKRKEDGTVSTTKESLAQLCWILGSMVVVTTLMYAGYKFYRHRKASKLN